MNIFSFNKKYTPTVITLVCMVALGAAYFFIYVPLNEKNLQQQRFRTLQNIDRNIHVKIDNSLSVVNLLVKAYHDTSDKKAIRNYIEQYPRDKFELSQPIYDNTRRLDSLEIGDSHSVLVNNKAARISILSQPMISKPGVDTAFYRMSIHYQIPQFLKNLLPANVFDEYVIFNKGEPIYESFPAGISGIKADSILNIGAGISGSVIRDCQLGGTAFKMFLQPVNFSDNQWVIAGLLSDSRYNKEKTQLPAQIVLLLVTILVIFLLFFPWIRLYQMGSQDRLTTGDVVSTVVVSMLLMSLLFFSFFKYNVPFRSINATQEKKALADTIVNAFKKETDSAYQMLKSLDEKVASGQVRTDLVRLGSKKDSTQYSKDAWGVLKSIDSTIKGFPIKQAYWLSPDGDEKINWTTGTVNGPHGNFKERSYFVKIQNQSAYRMRDSADKLFYLDPLVSRTSGVFTTVLSIPSAFRGYDNDTGNYVAGMSFTIKSLQQVVLPTGFTYALINNEGTVLYHSDNTKSLNENLQEEFINNKTLISCLQARTEGYFKTGYFSNDYYVYMRPVSGLPYFIVIMEDAGFKATRDLEVYSFAFSSMLFFFGFMFVQILVSFLVSSRRSFFKKQVFNTSWIGPKKSSHRQYNIACVAHMGMILLLLLFYRHASFLLYVFILLYAVTFLSLFLNVLFARKYKDRKPNNYKYKIVTIRWLTVCIVLIDLVSLLLLDVDHWWMLMLFEALSVVMCTPLYLKGDALLNNIRRSGIFSKVRDWNYVTSFTLMALTRLIVTSGIPVMFFYITAFNYEQNLDTRYKQFQFAKQVVNKLDTGQIMRLNDGFNYTDGIYADGAWINKIKLFKLDTLNGKSETYTPEEKRTLLLLNLFRLNLSDKSVNDDQFYAPYAADLTRMHNHLLDEACKDNCGAYTSVETKIPGYYLEVISANLNYKFPPILCVNGNCKGPFYWALFLVALGIFYAILLSIIKKLFALNLPDLSEWRKLDDAILFDNKLNNLLFVIGLPGSGKLTRLLQFIKDEKMLGADGLPYRYKSNDGAVSDVFVADLMNIPDSSDDESQQATWQQYSKKIFDPKNRLVIINHFEYNIQDANTTRIKLNLLERLMVQNSSRVTILSTIHPVAFLESVYDLAFRPAEAVPGQDLERWHVLLGHFRIVVFPLQVGDEPLPKNRFEQMIAVESRTTHFLNKMQPSALSVAKNIDAFDRENRKADELALKLQMTSHYFYMYIWQSLTKEEKFLLYDHAEDNLVNSFDDYNLNMLVSKGVLIRVDGSLKIFNDGFRNFILSAIGSVEAMKIKRQIKDNGNWNRLKNPMIVIIVAILVFLIASQQETYTKLITYAAALGTGIPVLMKLFSLFDSPKEKNT